MNHNVYLPDDVSERAKAAELNLSRLLRDAVVDEVERRAAVSATLEDVQEYKLPVESIDGFRYVGRITGKLIAAGSDGETTVYVTDDERVIVHDARRLAYWEVNDPQEELRGLLNVPDYCSAMAQLGLEPVVDL